MNLPTQLNAQLLIRNDDVIVKNHQLHDTPLLPGVTYIDILFRALRAKGVDPREIELRNLLFKHPVTTSATYDTRIHLSIERQDDHWRATARSKRIAGEQVLDDSFSENMECTIHTAPPLTKAPLDVNRLIRQASDVAGMDELYAKARMVDLVHRDFMKSLGKIHIGDTYLLAEIELNPAAKPFLPHFFIHPGGMDSSTIVPFTLPRELPEESQLKAFIPLYIESFRVAQPPGERFYVFVELHRYPQGKGDVTYNDLEVYDLQGNLCTLLRKMAAKQVRKSELITNLKQAEKIIDQPSVLVQEPTIRQSEPQAPIAQASSQENQQAMEEKLTTMIAALRGISPAKVDRAEGFYDQGLDSANLLKLVRDLERELDTQLYPTLLFEYSNIEELAEYLAEETGASPQVASSVQPSTQPPASNETPVIASPEPASHEALLISLVASMRDVPAQKVDPDEGFYDQGLDSTSLLKLVRELETRLNCELYPTLLFEYPNIRELAMYLAEIIETETPPKPEPVETSVPDIDVGTHEQAEGTLYLKPYWQSAPRSESASITGDLLVLELDQDLTRSLRSTGHITGRVISVMPGREFRVVDENHYQVNVDDVDDYKRLAAHLADQGVLPTHILHTWSAKHFTPTRVAMNAQLHKSVYAVMFLAQAWLKQKLKAPLRLIHVYADPSTQSNPHYGAVGAIAKCARIENPRLLIKSVGVDGEINWENRELTDRVLGEFGEDKELEVRLTADDRRVQRYKDFTPEIAPKLPIQENQVILITGGAGGLGLLFAKDLATTPGVKLALAGRSPSGPRQQAAIEELEALGATVRYYAADVADRDGTKALINRVRNELGPINGVLHSAGVLADDYLVKKTAAQVDKVLDPKVYAAIYLDEATRTEPLEWTVYFSSISAVTGNPGQSDYAAGNAFLDRFAAKLNALHKDGKRSGRTVSINWPLWRAGGMLMEPEAEARHLEATGMRPLATETGLHALRVALSQDAPQITVIEGRLAPLQAMFGLTPPPVPQMEQAGPLPRTESPNRTPSRQPVVASARESQLAVPTATRDIAVIGLAGRYPGAYDVDDFWNLLQQGRDAIKEIPLERWDLKDTFSTDRSKRGKIYSKWGGFIDDADKFDPLFFKIPPLAAIVSDPQERLFLETCWHTMEDACYTREDLAGKKIGVYAGVMWNQYQIFGAEQTNAGNPMALSGVIASIANRVSFCLNLSGPSLTLDTMCSSSLTALHLACESIIRGETVMAFAGGVNLSLHPNKYLLLSQNQMVSGDGRCKAFGKGGDGYVPGEGVGAVLLKPLDQALVDRDQIYGVIKATALNHGGKASGYTVPNPKAQSEVIRETIEKAGVPAASIGYIETHGTGTELGDPVEITGLNRAFRDAGLEAGRVPIGSVKSNIGHLESAAGVSSLTKTLLQLRHKALVPSIHTRELNDKIDWEKTPFRVQRTFEPWNPITNDQGRSVPRRAGISSFGAGGSNAHIIMEEAPARTTTQDAGTPQLLILSAQNEDRLRAYAAKTADWIDAGLRDGSPTAADMLDLLLETAADVAGVDRGDLDSEEDLTAFGFDPSTFQALVERLNMILDQDLSAAVFAEAASIRDLAALLYDRGISAPPTAKTVSLPTFADAAWSFQIGRSAFEERLAIVASDFESWRTKLRAFLAGETQAGLHTANALEDSSDAILLGNDPEDRAYLDAVIQRGNLDKIGMLWTRGATVDWTLLHPRDMRYRVSVPGYPFARERYWFSGVETKVPAETTRATTVAALHPLVDRNESTLEVQRYRKTFQTDHYLLHDHLVRDQVVLPGTAYLQMAFAAGFLASSDGVTGLRDLVWQRPFVMEAPERDLHIELFPEKDGIAFEILTDPDGSAITHCIGSLISNSQLATEDMLDLKEIRDRCDQHMTRRQAYEAYSDMGFGYGPAFQVTHAIHANAHESLAELRLPEAARDGQDWTLHPALVDGALRSVSAISSAWSGDEPQLHIPFALGAFDLIQPLPARIFAHATLEESSPSGMVKFNITITGEKGQVVAKLRDFAARAVKEGALGEQTTDENRQTLYLEPVWLPETPLIDSEMTGPVLVYTENQALFIATSSALSERGIRAIHVQNATEFAQEENQIAMPIDDLETVTSCWQSFGEDQPGAVLMLQALETPSDVRSDLDQMIPPLLALIAATSKVGLNRSLRVVQAVTDGSERPHLSAFAGVGKALKSVNHRFELVTLSVEGDHNPVEAAITQALWSGPRGGVEARQDLSGLSRHGWDVVEPASRSTAAPRKGGVYLITGGSGGLGRIFAKHLAENYGAKLVLAGRSPEDEEKRSILEELKQLGGDAIYVQADIVSEQGAETLAEAARTTFGAIHGVFHAAGFLGQDSITQTTYERFSAPLGPKIFGTLALDHVCANDDLDLFVTFGSVSEEMGDFGTGCYSMGNRFLGNFAHSREVKRARGERKGMTLNVAWPLWQTGGMSLPEDEAAMYFNYSGMAMLESSEGLALFEKALLHGAPHLAAAIGNETKIRKVLGLELPTHDSEPVVETVQEPIAEVTSPPSEAADPLAWAVHYLKGLLSEAIQLSTERISARASFEKYGIDSIVIMDLNERLGETFSDLPKTLFFEYDTIDDLAEWLVANRTEKLRSLAGEGTAAAPSEQETQSKPIEKTASQTPVSKDQPAKPRQRKRRPRFRTINEATNSYEETQETSLPNEPIAIIGMSGRYPGANGLDTFWENLASGKDSIEDIPKNRWHHEPFFDPKVGTWGKSYGRYGGFIDGVEEFDPLFFNISPAKADFVDPQERLVLESVWQTMENAGYTRDALTGSKRDPKPVGMFMASMYNLYPYLTGDPGLQAALSVNSYSSIANRASYFFNFQGPSLAIDTACSGALTAIHLGCESIRRGDCHVAFAGGINLSLHPNKYIGLSNGQIIGSTAESRCLGDGDGFIPGEGVGSVLLKPLRKAQQDGDRILAVVRGSAVNHGGRTNAFQVPNPNAQARVIREAIDRAGLKPSDLEYLEIAANGSSLGDPIEIAALSKAFSGQLAEGKTLPIGTVKSNIGHLEAASGVSQLTKVILQMQNRTLVPSLHADPPNPNLDLASTPFRVQSTTESWLPNQSDQPLRAGIASFGAGGSNAYLVLESAPETPMREKAGDIVLPWVFSARKKSQLKAQAKQVRNFLDRNEDINLLDVAFTLTSGREAMSHRLAFSASNRDEILSRLDTFLAGEKDDSILAGAHDLSSPDLLARNEEREPALEKAISNHDLAAIIDGWVDGADIAWQHLAIWKEARRVALPTYPFERKRYWLFSEDQAASFEPVQPTIGLPSGTPQTELQSENQDAELATETFTEALCKEIATFFGKEPDSIQPEAEWQVLDLKAKDFNLLAGTLASRFDVGVGPRIIESTKTPGELAAHMLALGARWEPNLLPSAYGAEPQRTPTRSSKEPRQGRNMSSKAETAKNGYDLFTHEILTIFGDMMRVEPDDLSLTADLFDYGYDSLAAAKLQTRLEEHYRISLNVRDVSTVLNLSELITLLREQGLEPEGQDHPQSLADEPSDDSLEKALLTMFSDMMRLDPEDISMTADLADYGYDSLAASRLQQRIDEQLHVDLPVRDVTAALNIHELLEMVRAANVDGIKAPNTAADLTSQTENNPANDNLEELVLTAFCQVMDLEKGSISPTEDVTQHGFDSLTASRLCKRLSDKLGRKIPIRLVRESNHLRDFATKLSEDQPMQQKLASNDTDHNQLKTILSSLKAGKISPAQAARLRAQIKSAQNEEVHP